MAGRTVAVTGPTSGLGLAAARAMARLGARVILVGRREAPLRDLAAALAAESGADRYRGGRRGPVVPAIGRAAPSRRSSRPSRASTCWSTTPARSIDTRRETEDGIEATLALMVVGPFVLEAGLLPLLEATPGSRVIAVTSGGMYTQRLPLDDLGYRSGEYTGPKAYARAKRAQVALVREWSRRIHGRVAFAAMHPGWADTPGLAESLPGFYRVMRPLLALTGAGDRHDPVARDTPRADPDRRAPVPRPACAAVRPRSLHAPHGGRPAPALGSRHEARRYRGSRAGALISRGACRRPRPRRRPPRPRGPPRVRRPTSTPSRPTGRPRRRRRPTGRRVRPARRRRAPLLHGHRP